MTVRRGGLGRGLGALIPTAPRAEDSEPVTTEGQDPGGPAVVNSTATTVDVGARFEELAVGSIEPNPKQPRDDFDPDAMTELVTSIREVGVLQPVVVREVSAGRYQLIMGERRWRASRAAGMQSVPAIVRHTSDDHLLRDALLENLHRQQLNPLEEAAAYSQLLAEFGSTHEELAERLGRSRSQISNTIRLMNLPAGVQRRVAAGVISAGHARALLALPDTAAQEDLAGRIVAEGLSVRAVEEIVTSPPPEGQPGPVTAPRQRREPSESASATAHRLSEVLDTTVTIMPGRRRGKIVISYAGDEDLARIAELIATTGGGAHDSASRASSAEGDDSQAQSPVAGEVAGAGWPQHGG